MKVKCINNTKDFSLRDVLGDRFDLYHNFSLIEGVEYNVYAIRELYNHIWYCIFDEDSYSYPRWNPYPLFEVTDPRLSQYWIFSLNKSDKKMTPLITFPEWAHDPEFYTNLVEGDSADEAAIIFNKYKELIDLEFPDSSITRTAKIGDKEWLICPNCVDAWQSSSTRNAMVRCANCKEILHNPRYPYS